MHGHLLWADESLSDPNRREFYACCDSHYEQSVFYQILQEGFHADRYNLQLHVQALSLAFDGLLHRQGSQDDFHYDLRFRWIDFLHDAGNYLRLEYPEDNPLTKIEHEPFTPEDYERLDKILKDKKSILQKHSLAYLATEPDKEKNKKKPEKKSDEDVDGETKATPAAVKEAVVKDAAWTTWVLWTYANIEIVPILQTETESQVTPAYLQKTLNSKNWQRIEFILNYLLKKKIYSTDYVNSISSVLAKTNMEQIELALSYVKKSSQDKNDYFKSIIRTLPGMGNYNAALIIEELANEEKLDNEILMALTDTLDKVSYYAVHLSLRIIESKQSFSSKIEHNTLTYSVSLRPILFVVIQI